MKLEECFTYDELFSFGTLYNQKLCKHKRHFESRIFIKFFESDIIPKIMKYKKSGEKDYKIREDIINLYKNILR